MSYVYENSILVPAKTKNEKSLGEVDSKNNFAILFLIVGALFILSMFLVPKKDWACYTAFITNP